MKIIFTTITFIFISYFAFGQERINGNLYKFNNQYFDVVKHKYENVEGILVDDFKNTSKFATRFTGLSIDQVGFRGTLFKMLDNNGLLATNLETSAANPLINNEKDIPRRGQNYLLRCNTGVIHIKNLEKANGYMVYKYNQKAEEEFAVQIKHSEYVDKGNIQYHLPYLKYKTHTGSSIVFTSYIDRIPKTVILSTSNGAVSNFDFTCIGIIRDEANDMDVHGFIKHKKGSDKIDITYISDEFSIQKPYFSTCNIAESILIENVLYVVTYNDMQNGVNLFAVDLNTKSIKWESNVAKITNVPAQYFFNMIWLSEHQGNIILEGYESGGRYLQIFDKTTGALKWKSF